MIIRDKETLNELINLSIASAKIQKLSIEMHNGRIREIRPQIHLMISGDKGTLKSTILSEIANVLGTHINHEVTDAGLIGSISKNGDVIVGSAWGCRNKALILDEFEFTDKTGREKSIVNILLNLSEGRQEMNKKLGRNIIKKVTKRDDDLYCVTTVDGWIKMKTRFSLIIGTMRSLQFRNLKLDALKSRCLAIEWKPNFDLLLDVSKGNYIFQYYDYSLPEPEKKVPQKDYILIHEHLTAHIVQTGVFLRALEDCCRVFAITKKHDYRLYNLILSLKS